MIDKDRRTSAKPGKTISDYLRPSLRALYPPPIRQTPKDIEARLERLRRLRFILSEKGDKDGG
jgi:hypothetical protein